MNLYGAGAAGVTAGVAGFQLEVNNRSVNDVGAAPGLTPPHPPKFPSLPTPQRLFLTRCTEPVQRREDT